MTSPLRARPLRSLVLLTLATASLAAMASLATASPDVTAPAPSRYTLRPSVMLGLLQWTLFGGGNIAGQVKYKRLVFEYSHGQALQFHRVASFAQTEAERDAGVEVESPWTTGGGAGFQITPNLHLMVEVKAHHFLVRGATGDQLEYTSFTVGPGLFYDIYLTKHLFVQPNLRWWPTVASTYDRDATLMADDGTPYRHARHDLVPFANVNLGWTFDGR